MASTSLPQTVTAIADELVQHVAEFDDRTSPDDFPEALLITSEELHALLLEMAERAADPGATQRGRDEERFRIRREFLAVIENRLEEGYIRQLLDRIAPEEWTALPVAEPAPKPTPETIDLMQALEASLTADRKARGRRKPAEPGEGA